MELIFSRLSKIQEMISILWDFDVTDPRSRRKRLIALAAVYSVLARGVSMLAGLAQVPIALHYLKSEAFGLWMTLVGGVQLMSFADLGMGLGLQNKISEAYGRDDYQSVRDFYKTGWLILAAIGLGIALVILPLCWLIPWAEVFKIHDPLLKTEVPETLAVILVFFCLNLPLNAGVRLAVGMQLSWVAGVWNAVSSIICLGLIVLGKHWGVGFIILVSMAMSAAVIANIGMIGHTFHVLGKTFPRTKGRYRSGLPGELLRQGILFLLPQMGAVMLYSAPAVLIASTLGTTAVTPFNLCQRICNVLLSFQQLPLAGLWPAYAEAKSRGDYDWVWKVFVKSCYYAVATGVIFALALIFLGRIAITTWTSGVVIPSNELLIVFGIWVAIQGSQGGIPMLLNGCGELLGQVMAATLCVILLLLTTHPLLKHFGLSGMVYAMILSYCAGVPLMLPGILRLHKTLKGIKTGSTIDARSN